MDKININVNTDLLKGLGISTLLYAGYLELSPKMKNVWLRTNAEDGKTFSPQGLFNMMKKPFTDKVMWYPQMLDLNYVVFTSTMTTVYMGVKKLMDKHNEL